LTRADAHLRSRASIVQVRARHEDLLAAVVVRQPLRARLVTWTVASTVRLASTPHSGGEIHHDIASAHMRVDA
jgi:hypothetical protein